MAKPKQISDERRLVERADAVARKLGFKRSTMSIRLFNAGGKLDRLAQGGEIYHSAYVAADQTLAAMERECGIK